MNKSVLEIAEEQGAYITNREDGWIENDKLLFDNEAQLIATINAYNAQVSEFVGEIVCDARTGHTVNIFTGDKPYPNIGTKLYTSPQTLPPEWAEYVERLERALLDAQESINRFVSDEGSTQKDFDTADHVSNALASKPKEQ